MQYTYSISDSFNFENHGARSMSGALTVMSNTPFGTALWRPPPNLGQITRALLNTLGLLVQSSQ